MSRFIARIRQNYNSKIITMLALVTIFQLWDGIMTQILVKNGIVREYNTLVNGLIINGQFLIIKIISPLIISLVLLSIYRYFPRLVLTTATIITGFYSAVLLWNFYVLFQTAF
jgi:hypothetical protein